MARMNSPNALPSVLDRATAARYPEPAAGMM